MTQLKETKEAVEFFVKLLNWVSYALEDGKVDFKDILALAPCLSSARAAFDGFREIPEELSDFSEEDKEELIAYIRGEFDLESDNIEGMVEYVAQLALEMLRFYTWVKEKRE